MKDYKVYINLKTQELIVTQLFEHGVEVYQIVGCLNDTYFANTEDLQDKVKFNKRVKMRKYIILGREYANEWGDHLYILLTDNEKLVDDLYQEWEKQYDDDDESEEHDL